MLVSNLLVSVSFPSTSSSKPSHMSDVPCEADLDVILIHRKSEVQ